LEEAQEAKNQLRGAVRKSLDDLLREGNHNGPPNLKVTKT
jgi:hypothetical protein